MDSRAFQGGAIPKREIPSGVLGLFVGFHKFRLTVRVLGVPIVRSTIFWGRDMPG